MKLQNIKIKGGSHLQASPSCLQPTTLQCRNFWSNSLYEEIKWNNRLWRCLQTTVSGVATIMNSESMKCHLIYQSVCWIDPPPSSTTSRQKKLYWRICSNLSPYHQKAKNNSKCSFLRKKNLNVMYSKQS